MVYNRTMEKEVWKDIKGYEGLYQVSNLGRVKAIINKTHKVEKILRPRRHSRGYLRVSLSKNGKEKDFYIHRLAGEAFIDNPRGLKEINHRDGNKTSNICSNLEWADRSTQELHKLYVLKRGRARPIRCIETGQIFESISKAAQYVGGDSGNLSSHLRKKPNNKRFAKLHWEYVS